MIELSLFSGAGGGLLATHHMLGWRTAGYVENSDYCQRVLRARIDDGLLDDAPIFGDIRSFIDQGYAASYQGLVDIITAGFPCTPFSVAGKQLGAVDPRNKWPETAESICIIRPRCVFLENVPNLLSGSHGYFGHILGNLAELGYDARWGVLSAADVGAPHLRRRLWIVAHSVRDGVRDEPRRIGRKNRKDKTKSSDDGAEEFVAYAARVRRSEGRPESARKQGRSDAAQCCSTVGYPDVQG